MQHANLIRMQVSRMQIQRFRRKIKRKSFTMAYFIKYFILINALIVSFCLIMSCVQVKNQFLKKSELLLFGRKLGVNSGQRGFFFFKVSSLFYYINNSSVQFLFNKEILFCKNFFVLQLTRRYRYCQFVQQV